MRLDTREGWGEREACVNAFPSTVFLSTANAAVYAQRLRILESFQISAAPSTASPGRNTFPFVSRLITDSSTSLFRGSFLESKIYAQGLEE